MPYYTDYTLDTLEHLTDDEFHSVCVALGDYDEVLYCCDTNITWYEHEQDMRRVSQKFPHLTFILEGYVQSKTDLWKKRFINGRMDIIRPITKWPEFPAT